VSQVWGPHQSVPEQPSGYRSTDGTTYFDHQDTLGTERIRTNYAGSVGSSYISLPWGDGYTATVNNSGADQDSLHFASLEHDAESDTEHAQFRNYASAQGRWLAPDPYMGSYDLTNPQSMNRYAYVLNNPTSLLDPSGLVVTCNEINGCFDCDPNDTACASTGDCVANGTEGCITASNPGNTTTLQPTPSYPSSGGSGAPNKTTCTTGFGAGITVGADAVGGLGYGVGGNGSVGAGLFGGNGINAGAFASGGAGASAFGHGASAPGGNLIGRFFLGLVGGAGGGIFLTNASQASQLQGLGGTWNVDFGDFVNGAAQFSAGTDGVGNNIWSFSFTLGAGLGAGYHQITNSTVTAGRKGGC
jgi:RHS repeat-associated protein